MPRNKSARITQSPRGVNDSKFEERLSRRLSTINQFCERHPEFTPPAIRKIRFNSRHSHKDDKTAPYKKFSSAFIKFGNRVWIDDDRFFEILEENRGE